MTPLPKIIFIGDSHTHAVRVAITEMPEISKKYSISAFRLTKIKNNKLFGDINFEDAKLLCSTLGPDDLVVSQIGGNQHSTFSLIQHPEPFDVMTLQNTNEIATDLVTWIPHNTLKAHFDQGMRGNDIRRIIELAEAGTHQTLHLMAPPPKEDTDHILKRIEAYFLSRGIEDNGVSSAKLRLRIWKIQNEVLADALEVTNIELLPPPTNTCTQSGFLEPMYYGVDATHANSSYGIEILKQIDNYVKKTAKMAG